MITKGNLRNHMFFLDQLTCFDNYTSQFKTGLTDNSQWQQSWLAISDKFPTAAENNAKYTEYFLYRCDIID